MNNEERILFEEYIQIIGYNGEQIDDNYLKIIINTLLNSKELENHELLTLKITTDTQDLKNFTIYATYYNKTTLENKDMTGKINIKNNKIYLIANIHDYSKQEDFELGELFETKKNNITRFTTYNNKKEFITIEIPKNEYNKVENYIEETLTKIKRRGK